MRIIGERIAFELDLEYYAAPDEPDYAPRWWDQDR